MTHEEQNTFESITAKGRRLLHEAHDPTGTHRDFEYWDSEVARWLDAKYPESGLSAKWSSVSTSPLVSGGQYYDFPETWKAFRVAVQQRLSWLGDLGSSISTSNKYENRKYAKTSNISNRVFIVHGHNDAVREAVARFLEKLGLEVIILHEQPNKGRTIIEKFVDYSDVVYAVILLTADDIGNIKGTMMENMKPRARQNVIFELGYFLGKLGRERVCALYEEGVEVLSDYSGVIYITIDAHNAWKLQLAKELKATGLSIDMNKSA
jgi:predicted nucleotide-binding protein